MEKHIEISILWQIYGKLLTEKQYNALNDYYNEDLSLAEIAEQYDISRQAVRDIIKKGEQNLFEYEKVLHIMKRTQENEKTIQLVLAQVLNEVQKELSYIV